MRHKRMAWWAFILGITSVFMWLMSYSWIILVVLPWEGLELAFNPWLLFELLAVGIGVVAAVVGVVAQASATSEERPFALASATMGAVAALFSGVSLLAPV